MIFATMGSRKRSMLQSLVQYLLCFTVVFALGMLHYVNRTKHLVIGDLKFVHIEKQNEVHQPEVRILEVHAPEVRSSDVHAPEVRSSDVFAVEKRDPPVINEPKKPNVHHVLRNHTHRQTSTSTKAPSPNRTQSIAIGLGISTRHMKIDIFSPTWKQVQDISLFADLLPSFCRSYTAEFQYHFYIAYDYNDPFLSTESHVALFKGLYRATFGVKWCKDVPAPDITLLKVNHTKKPAWAQNDAMMRAYLDHHDYYYRINDDTVLLSPYWQKSLIEVLTKYDPPNVGVVGPTFMIGNLEILTYDFVHRTHIDIFGFYYPRVFEGWHGDEWISFVYMPHWVTKHKWVWIEHKTEKYGQRYPAHEFHGQEVERIIKSHSDFFFRYLEYNAHNVRPPVKSRKSRIISFSLEDHRNEASLHGLLRNVILAKQYLPSWTVRLTVPKDVTIPKLYWKKLQLEGLDIRYIATNRSLPSRMLRHLVIDDPQVELFLIRDVHSRIGPREMLMVKEWLESGKGIHCIVDHPAQDTSVISAAQWGGKTHTVRTLLRNRTMHETLMKFCGGKRFETEMFKHVFKFNGIKDALFCHNTVSCSSERFVHGFSMKRFQREYVGQKFDIHEIPQDYFPDKFQKKCGS